MFLKTIAAGLVALTALAAIPANATTIAAGYYEQPRWDGPRGDGPRWDHRRGDRWRNHNLTAQEVRYVLRDKGYRNITFVDARGRNYEVVARKGHRHYLMVVSARDGDIISRNRL
jgi:hypothetical protein